MESLNETKAKEIAKKLSYPNIDSFGDGDDEFDTRFYHACKDAALQAMEWKEKEIKDRLTNVLYDHSLNGITESVKNRYFTSLDEFTNFIVKGE